MAQINTVLGPIEPTPVLADFQAGVDAHKRGDFDTALREWRPLAEQGYASAQASLGIMYNLGQGVAQDYQVAVKLFRLVAEQGYAQAQFHLGQMYINGQGVPRDSQEAIRLFRLAGDQGLVPKGE